MPRDQKKAAAMAAIAEERVRRSCCCKVRACVRVVSIYGCVLDFGECVYGTAIFPHPDDGYFIVSSELTRCTENSNKRGGYYYASAYTDMRIQCNIDEKWIWAKVVWQGQNVTLCKIASTWFSTPHPPLSTFSCYACVLEQRDRCHWKTDLFKHHQQGLKVANFQDNNGRSVVVGGWWRTTADTEAFVAQPATVSVDALGLTLSVCITYARYSSGAPVLDSVTGEYVGIVKGDITNDNITTNGRQEVISAQEVHKIPWERH
ncbi:g1425 [Coccomyxa elongata]